MVTDNFEVQWVPEAGGRPQGFQDGVRDGVLEKILYPPPLIPLKLNG